MMTDVFGTLAAVAASLAASAVREIFNWYRARRKLRAANEIEFQKALGSDSLMVLGDYLDNAVGQFSVSEYGQNREVRRRVNMFIARVEEFVGKTADVERPERVVGASPRYTTEYVAADTAVDGDLETVERRVLAGELWDGLAHLRRVIEQRLRELAKVHSLHVPQRPGASRLVELLWRNGVGHESAWSSMRHVINICNRAVHGLEVSTAEALEAVRHSRQAFGALGLSRADETKR